MQAASRGFLSLGLKVLGAAIGFARPKLGKWWGRRQIPAASTEKISILIAKLGSDNAANSCHHSIREAIRSAMPGTVDVIAWPEELALKDGLDEAARADANETARKWMRAKNCDLLISGRIKSSNVVSLTFTPYSPVPISRNGVIADPQSYSLPIDTMDFPTAFIDDLGAAIAACAVANIRKHNDAGFVPAIEKIAAQLEKIIETPKLSVDLRTKARFFDCQALARGSLFIHAGRESDLRSAICASENALQLIDQSEFPLDWANITGRLGVSFALLGDLLGDINALDQAAESLRSTLPYFSKDLLLWTKAQLNLASVFIHKFQLSGSVNYLVTALEVYDQVICDELRQQDSTLWGTAQHNYGACLALFADQQAGDDALARALDAFGLALDVRTADFPRQRSDTLLNLSVALIALGSRQNILEWYLEAIHRLREATALVPVKYSPRKWLLIQNNLGLALALAGEEDSSKRHEAIDVLRGARGKVSFASPQVAQKISINLGKALMLAGKGDEELQLLDEAKSMLTQCLEGVDSTETVVRCEILNDLGLVYYHLGLLDEDIESLNEAREIFQQLCAELKDRNLLFRYMKGQQNLGLVLRAVGVKENSIQRLLESAAAFGSNLELVSKETAPMAWAGMQFYLAGTYFEIAKRSSGVTFLHKAQDASANALSILGPQYIGSLAHEARNLANAISSFVSEKELSL
jgi:tetratricopeptide (TPR) repeat protein